MHAVFGTSRCCFVDLVCCGRVINESSYCKLNGASKVDGSATAVQLLSSEIRDEVSLGLT